MGATTQAVFAEMVTTGAADKAISTDKIDDTSITFWRFVHAKYAVFALEPVDFDASASQGRFGAKSVKYQFPKQGDLVWCTFAKVYVPGIAGLYNEGGATKVLKGDAAPHWHNAIGQRVLSNVTFAVGGTQIISFDDTFMYIWEEISGKPGKQLGETIGKFDDVKTLQGWSKRGHWMYVPLPLPFTECSGNALPLASLQFHRVELELSFASREACVVLPPGAPAGTQICVRPDGTKDSDIESGAVRLDTLNDTHLQVAIEAMNVYVDDDERNKFINGQFEQCITEVQTVSAPVSYQGKAVEGTAPVRVKVDLPFANMVQEYLWVVRTQAKEAANQHYSFGGYNDGGEDGGSGMTLDPLVSATIKYGNSQRVQTRDGSYFRLVTPWMCHSNAERAAKSFIYNWSYAVDPESEQPSGASNHSRIDGVSMELGLDARIFTAEHPTAEIIVYGRAKNSLRYKQGVIVRKFT
jgi:hypothetical protein